MVGPIDIRINAAHPNIPLAPLYAFIGSPSSVRVRGVPLRIGKWDITAVNVTITLPDNSATTVPAVPVAGCWVATLPASPVTGYCAAGLQVTADGLDENGAAVTGYCLGVGDVTILSRDASASADGRRYYLHYLEDEPEHPQTGDTCYIGGVLKWYDGTSWRQFLDVVAPSTGATPGTAADAKATGDALADRPTKEQIDAGWWSEWTVSPSAPAGKRFYFEFSSSGQWNIFLGDEGGLDPSLPPIEVITPATGEETELQFDEYSIEYTATRHRVAAPVPTKTSGLVNDGSDGEHPFLTEHQTWSEVKPSGGIPKTDLASAVQTSLGKADTAVQPSGIAGLMPMYPFSEPTMAQTGNWWTFSGTSAGTGYHYEIDYGGGEWSLYSVQDGESHGALETRIDYVAGFEEANEVIFSTAGVTATRGYVATVSPYTVATYTADSSAAAFEIAVGALPTGVTGKARDCIIVIDCTASGAVAPTVTWDTHFHPRTDTATDLAIVEAGKVAVFYISEYATGEFAVGGWVETDGGSGT